MRLVEIRRKNLCTWHSACTHACALPVICVLRKSKKIRVWMDFKIKFQVWGVFGWLGVVFGEIWARISRKVIAQVRPRQGNGSLSWSKSGPSWPMLALRRRLEAQLGGFGDDFGSIWRRFENILPHGSNSNNRKKPCFFNGFLLFWEFWWLVQASWALFLAMLAPRAHFGAHSGVMLRHVGAKMATKSAKMSQHRRKSAPRSMQ